MMTRSKWRMYLQSLIDFRMTFKKRRHDDDSMPEEMPHKSVRFDEVKSMDYDT